MRIVILGAGFGGLEVSTLLSEEFGDEVDVVLIDKGEGFVFGFSKLDVMFGYTDAAHVLHRFDDVVKPGVRFVRAEVTAIDPAAKVVSTDAGTFEADVLVVALGADLHPQDTPGLLEGGYEFYTVPGAFALRDVLDRFEGGRVVVGVTSTPFKCPPAPSETTLLVNDFLQDRGLRECSEVSLVMPLPVPIPPSPQASEAILAAFEQRGINWHANKLVRALDPDRKVAVLSDGSELGYDLFLGVPVHRAPAVVVALGADGGRLDPRGSADPADQVRGGVRGRRRHQRRHSQGRGVRRRSGIGGGGRDHRDLAQLHDRTTPTTVTGSATWSSAATRSPRST